MRVFAGALLLASVGIAGGGYARADVSSGTVEAKTPLTQALEALKDPSGEVRSHAADVIGGLGLQAQDAGDQLVPIILTDPDPSVRSHVANAIQFLGPAGHIPAIDRLSQALKSKDKKTRLQAERAL